MPPREQKRVAWYTKGNEMSNVYLVPLVDLFPVDKRDQVHVAHLVTLSIPRDALLFSGRHTGFEPVLRAPQALVLPLHQCLHLLPNFLLKYRERSEKTTYWYTR